ncbi:TPR-like protein [Mycena polygramma]|nr:TPR-like protein [Mycena polygramma]
MHESILLLPSGHRDRARFHDLLGDISVGCRETSAGMVSSLNQAVSAYDDAVRDDPSSAIYHSDLGSALCLRFERLGDLIDISRAVSEAEAALNLNPDISFLNIALHRLGLALWLRFERLGNLADIQKSVTICKTAVGLTQDGEENRPRFLYCLGLSLLSRFDCLGDITDINQAISTLEAAIQLTPNEDPDMPSLLNSTGNCLFRRFQRLEDLEDINRAIQQIEAAIKLTPDGHPSIPGFLMNLGNPLLSRFLHLEDLADINLAVSTFESAVQLMPEDHPNMSACRNNLANSLRHRFPHSGEIADINRAISEYHTVVQLTPNDHPDMPSRLHSLGNSLHRRFEHSGDVNDINQAVSISETAAQLTPAGHASMFQRLGNLGNCLLGRFEHMGDLTDINQAISNLETAVQLTPDGHPEMRITLDCLGICLFRRYERLGDLMDINQAVSTAESAARLTPHDHPSRARYLNGLGNSLHCRFMRSGNINDINQAISSAEAAVQLTPDGHPEKAMYLNSLAALLISRFGRVKDPTDVDLAISKAEAAIKLTPDHHSDMPTLLSSLGTSLISRFEKSGNITDLHDAVNKTGRAVQLTPDGHPDLPMHLMNHGASLERRFRRLLDSRDYEEMLDVFTRAACFPTGATYRRFEAARAWARAAEMFQHPSCLEAYGRAIELLPELAWLGLSISDRHHHIRQAGQVVRDAASAAITSNQLSTAVEWLDQGRSVIWGQILNLRTPVDDLRKFHPDLADDFVSCSSQLETAGIKSHILVGPDDTKVRPHRPLQSVAQDSHALADKRDRLLKQIRKLPKFERFLLPKQISNLSLAAAMGPIVMLNITKHRCDALILITDLEDDVIHVPLPDFTLQDAQQMGKSLTSLVSGAARSERLKGHRQGDMPPNEQFSRMLSVLWMKIVKPVLDGLACPALPNPELSRIWWCPTGPLAFLPIHAAGFYGKDQARGSKLSDFFISSYTPSLTVLIEGLRARHKSEQKLQILAVAQPSAAGHAHIPGTMTEIDSIQRAATIPSLRLERNWATVENVENGMKTCAWAHFACHGVQDTSDPTNSALLLAGNSRLTLSRIIQLSLPNTDLAFLSACQTATGSKDLEDESVHLTAGMLLAGYRGVIGTMWSIMDDDAPKVARDIYEHLFQTSLPDSTRAAEALHLAVGKLRDSDMAGGAQSFSRWVPFIHVGV